MNALSRFVLTLVVALLAAGMAFAQDGRAPRVHRSPGGIEYVNGAAGEVFAIDQAGPWLLLKVPPGAYTVRAQVAGASQERAVKVGAGLQTLNWRFAAS